MPISFPSADRIELKRSPLELVVCQLRFPTILPLAANNPPENFQKKIRSKYPVPRRQQRKNLELRDAGGQVSVIPSTSSFWSFEDKESQWIVSLGADFLSLEAKKYRRFDEFIERFRENFNALNALYDVELMERLGLRYIDRISKTRFPDLPSDWPSRLNPEVIPLRSMRSESLPQIGNLEVRFSNADRILAIRSAFIDKGFPGASESEFIFDTDCYAEKRAPIAKIEESLMSFRELSYRAFRWAIGDLIDRFDAVNGKRTS